MRLTARLSVFVAVLLAAACTAPQPETRWQDHAVSTWAEKLTDPDPWVRAGAADALGRMGPEAAGASGVLLNRFRQDEADEVRARSARALGAIGAVEAKASLLEALRGDEELSVRAGAAEALVNLGAGDELLPLLLEALDARPDTETLQAVCNGFAALGSRSVEPLRERLSPIAPAESRTSVALCLGAVGARARSVVPELVALLEEPQDRLRLAAIIALGSIGGQEACSALASTVALDPSPALQLEAWIAGAQSCDFEPVEDEPAQAD